VVLLVPLGSSEFVLQSHYGHLVELDLLLLSLCELSVCGQLLLEGQGPLGKKRLPDELRQEVFLRVADLVRRFDELIDEHSQIIDDQLLELRLHLRLLLLAGLALFITNVNGFTIFIGVQCMKRCFLIATTGRELGYL